LKWLVAANLASRFDFIYLPIAALAVRISAISITLIRAHANIKGTNACRDLFHLFFKRGISN
jgi:hypothetical protein